MKIIEANFLSVYCGDAILLRFPDGNNFVNILIDGGYVKTYQTVLKPQLRCIKNRGERLDMVILTHYDSDHIGGIIAFLNDPDFNASTFVDRWVTNNNLPIKNLNNEISKGQLLKLTDFLRSFGKAPDTPFTCDHLPIQLFDAKLTFLSPNIKGYQLALNIPDEAEGFVKLIGTGVRDTSKSIDELRKNINNTFLEDASLPNGSSIGVLLELGNFKCLLLGDAHPSVIATSLQKLGFNSTNRLKVNWVKLSHHGSKFNTSDKLLDCISCENYILSVNGLNRPGLPNKETLVRIIDNGHHDEDKLLKFYFTHNDSALRNLFSVDEDDIFKLLNFDLLFPENMNTGIRIETSF